MKGFSLFIITLLFPLILQAEVSSNFSVTSDYVWRGQSQTNNGPAVQGGFDYESNSGFSLGTWVSNICFSCDDSDASNDIKGAEVDFYGSYGFNLSDSFSLSLGYTFYHYTKSGANDTIEYNLSMDISSLSVGVNYIGDYFGSSISSMYFSLGKEFELSKEKGMTLGLSLGFTTFDDESAVSTKNYLDYNISLNKSFEDNTISIIYTDTTRKTLSGTTESETDDSVFSVSASKSF